MNVYDFDKTIYHKDSTVDFYFYQLKKNPSLIRFAPVQLVGFVKYKLNLINKTELKRHIYKYLKGVKDIDKEVEEFWDGHINGVNSFYLQRHQDDDVVISGSAYWMVKPACDRLDIKCLIASEVDRFNGEVLSENCSDQQKVIRFRQAGFDTNDIDIFYSDSHDDEPMARLAKKAYLVKNGNVTDWEF